MSKGALACAQTLVPPARESWLTINFEAQICGGWPHSVALDVVAMMWSCDYHQETSICVKCIHSI
jgi:hypothetical protein